MIAPYRLEDASLFDVVRFKAWHAGESRQDLDEYPDATERFEPRWMQFERELQNRAETEDQSASGLVSIAGKFAGWAWYMVLLVGMAALTKVIIPPATLTINGESVLLPPHAGVFDAAIALTVVGTFVLTVAPDAWAALKRRGWDLRVLATVALTIALILEVARALPAEWRHPTWILVVIGILLGLAQLARGIVPWRVT